MTNKKGFASMGVVVAVILVVVLAGLYYYSTHRSGVAPYSENGASTSTGAQGGTVQQGTSGGGTKPAASTWRKYYFPGSIYLTKLSFDYPSNWTVSQSFYKSLAEQAAGLPGAVQSLTIKPPSGSVAAAIYIGGYQATCGSSIYGQRACFGTNTPVWTTGTDSATAAVFVHVVASMR